jgi:hypothetical protein
MMDTTEPAHPVPVNEITTEKNINQSKKLRLGSKQRLGVEPRAGHHFVGLQQLSSPVLPLHHRYGIGLQLTWRLSPDQWDTS